MILISHRGNISGPNPARENNPEYLSRAVELGYSVELDLWCRKNEYFLGHDEPIYKIEKQFLLNDKFWIHCKNNQAILNISQFNKRVHYFWHEKDSYTITSHGIIWAYPGSLLNSKTVCVLPESINVEENIKSCYGVCSDFIERYAL
jgi:hypothetical protein